MIGPIDWHLEQSDLPGWATRWTVDARRDWLYHLPPPRVGTGGTIGFAWSSILADMDRDPCGRHVDPRFDTYLRRTAA